LKRPEGNGCNWQDIRKYEDLATKSTEKHKEKKAVILNRKIVILGLKHTTHGGDGSVEGLEDGGLDVGPLNKVAEITDVFGTEFLEQAADVGDVIAALFLQHFRPYFRRDALAEAGGKAITDVTGNEDGLESFLRDGMDNTLKDLGAGDHISGGVAGNGGGGNPGGFGEGEGIAQGEAIGEQKVEGFGKIGIGHGKVVGGGLCTIRKMQGKAK